MIPPNPYPEGVPNLPPIPEPVGFHPGLEVPEGRPTRTTDNAKRITIPPPQGRPKDIRWEQAPATSHIGRFALDGKDLYVSFRDRDGHEVAQWVYHFRTTVHATTVFDRMRSSPHPYGLVLYPDVIEEGIANERVG